MMGKRFKIASGLIGLQRIQYREFILPDAGKLFEPILFDLPVEIPEDLQEDVAVRVYSFRDFPYDSPCKQFLKNVFCILHLNVREILQYRRFYIFLGEFPFTDHVFKPRKACQHFFLMILAAKDLHTIFSPPDLFNMP